MIKAVVFDMDGVLIDAREWHYEALNDALKLFGVRISPEEHEHRFDGLPTMTKLRMLSESGRLPAALHPLVSRFKQVRTKEIALERLRPTFQHKFLLRELQIRGYRIACASNSVRGSVHDLLMRAGLLEFMEFTLSNEDVKEPKPSPEMYLEACKRLQLASSEVLVVEDNVNGIKAAEDAGCFVLKVSGVEEVSFQTVFSEIEAVNKC